MWHICMIKRALPFSCTKRERLLANSLLKTDFILLEVTLHELQTKNTVLVVDKGTLDNPSWCFNVARVTTKIPLKDYSIINAILTNLLHVQDNGGPVIFISSQLWIRKALYCFFIHLLLTLTAQLASTAAFDTFLDDCATLFSASIVKNSAFDWKKVNK